MNSIVAVATEARRSRAAKRARRVVLRILRLLKKDGQAVDIFVVSDAEIRQLNRRYRRKDRATNVLSFEAPVRRLVGWPASWRVAGFMGRGEIYLAPDYISRKNEDFDYMVIHGVLHVLGYDHEKKRDMMRMERLERRLMSQLKKGF